MDAPEELTRKNYTVQILAELAGGKEFEGNQIGPEHTIDQIEIIADLIELGYVDGHVLRDHGKAINIGGPRITASGRQYLKQLLADRASKRPGARLEKNLRTSIPCVVKWIAGILATVVAAILIAFFVKYLGLK